MSEPRHRVDSSWSVSSLSSSTLLIVFAFGFVFAVGGVSSRVMQSYHGLHHSAYVTQIANGIVAPSNPSSTASTPLWSLRRNPNVLRSALAFPVGKTEDR